MGDTERPPVERSSHPRTTQACQRCRSLKTRCLPSEHSGTCQRCLISKRECMWADAPRKAKRVRGPSRISQVEQKIDGLVATLVNPDSSRSISKDKPVEQPSDSGSRAISALTSLRPLAPGSWLPVPQSFEQQTPHTDQDAEPDQRFVEKLRMIHSFEDHEPDGSRPSGAMFTATAQNEPIIEGDLVKAMIQSGEADTLLEEYRSMADWFPFVPIPSDIYAHDLSTRKPMLLLAIITVASWKSRKLQKSLDAKYRAELANRTIIRPLRTLSLLQSMVVYLSWYHFVFSHRTQQIYPLLQYAIGLALDLGLHQENRRTFSVLGRTRPLPPLSPEEHRERRRAFLGCYYLSSAIAFSLLKPNLLKYTDYMGRCGESLRYDCEYTSDVMIDRLITLRRIEDQIHETLNAEETIDLPITDSRISMSLRFLETQLEEWKRHNIDADDNRALELSHAFTVMELHSVGLRPTDSASQPFGQTGTQLCALLCTLEAGKRFLDALLAFPAAEYHVFSFADWMRVPHVVLTMSRLCLPSDLHASIQWDVKAAQDRVRLDLYLESLCYRMQGLTSYDKVKQPCMDFWKAMHMILDLTHTWYCRKIKGKKEPPQRNLPNDLPTPENTENYSQTHHNVFVPSEMGSGDLSSHSHVATADTMDTTMPTYSDNRERHDPFGFMKDMEFDMDQFLDMGIWGSESYEGMGFGSGNTRE